MSRRLILIVLFLGWVVFGLDRTLTTQEEYPEPVCVDADGFWSLDPKCKDEIDFRIIPGTKV